MQTEEEFIKALQLIIKLSTKSYVATRALHEHYIESLSSITGKDKMKIEEEVKLIRDKEWKIVNEMISLIMQVPK